MKTKIQRWWDIPAALFLVGALFSAAIRLNLTNWTENLGRVEFVVFLASILGFALGKSAFRGRITFLMALAYSVLLLPWQLGLLMPNLDWLARLNIMYARLWYATADILANRPVKDPILFLATMMLLFWLASFLATYRLVRYANPWLPLLSLGGMILVIEYTVEMYHTAKATGGTYSFLYLLFALLLMGRIYFLRSRREWEQRGGTVEMEVGYDLGRGVAVAAVVVGLLAWNTPRIINFFDDKNPARERVTQSWQIFRDRISKAANSLRSESPAAVQSYSGNMFLGTGGNQSEVIQFSVKPENGRQPVRMYWAGRTYDEYRSGQWETTINGTRPMGPSAVPMVYPSWGMRHIVQFTFNTQIPLLRSLYFIDAPLDLTRNAQAIVSQSKDGALDLNAIMTDPPLKAGEPYTVRAQISEPTILSLKEAKTDYPDWVKQRYLQVPTNFSPRVVELARQIAGEEPTAYDKAMAITQYLRRTITYSISVPEAPRNRDPLEWFLFDQRSGFCNYYASAEVMMLRSLGVPARLVVGYAEGEWDANQNAYVVRGKDSHAWPEIYFPGLGWIVFEPTVSQPQSDYPLGSESQQAAGAGGSVMPTIQPTNDAYTREGQNRAQAMLEEQERARQQRTQQIKKYSPWAIGIVGTIVVAGLLVFLEIRRRKTTDLPLISWLEKTLDESGLRTPDWLRNWSRRALRTPMENLFASVSFMLRVWGQRVEPALTPAEQVSLLIQVVPGVKDQAQALLDEYQRAMYSQYPANMFRAKQAVSDIRSIGYRNWVMRLIGLEA